MSLTSCGGRSQIWGYPGTNKQKKRKWKPLETIAQGSWLRCFEDLSPRVSNLKVVISERWWTSEWVLGIIIYRVNPPLGCVASPKKQKTQNPVFTIREIYQEQHFRKAFRSRRNVWADIWTRSVAFNSSAGVLQPQGVEDNLVLRHGGACLSSFPIIVWSKGCLDLYSGDVPMKSPSVK